MKIRDIVEGKSENREIYDRIKSKGVTPGFDHERYTDMSDQGLEGPFRMKNGQVLYYDPREGKYYNRDTDMYVDYDDYRAMDEQSAAEADLNEISDKTVLSYSKKAFGDYVNATSSKDYDGSHKTDAHRRADKRSKGMKMADKRGAQELRRKEAEDFAKLSHDERQAYYKKNYGEGVDHREMDENDQRPGYVVKATDKPKKIKPSKGGESPHPYRGKLVGEAEVDRGDYEWTHGRKPSGKGSWFFVAHKGGINFGKHVEGEDYIQLNQMSYSDAKKAAVKWAKSKGHTQLFVAT